jgi:hypothetical protein
MQTPKDILQPKMQLTARELTFFKMIVNSRETATWSDNDLFIASTLAKTYRRIEELGEILDREGFTQVNDRGTQISNPIFAALTQSQAQLQSANRTLGLSASQRALTSSAQKNRNEADSHARDVIERVTADDLI